MSSFFDKIEAKHGGIPAGEHVIVIVPKSTTTWEKNGQSGFCFKVQIADGPLTGRVDQVRITLDGPYSNIIRDSLAPIKQWADGVKADVSDRAVGGDPGKLIATLRNSSEGSRVFGLFTQEKAANGRSYLRLVKVRVEEGKRHVVLF